jgi:hypothetical protein
MGGGIWWGRDQVAKVSNLLRGAVSTATNQFLVVTFFTGTLFYFISTIVYIAKCIFTLSTSSFFKLRWPVLLQVAAPTNLI